MNFYERVKALCEERGISIEEFSQKLGVWESTVYSWRKCKPRYDMLIDVADVFQISLDELVGRDFKK